MTTPVHALLDELADLVEQARAMPMSASCLVHRGEVLELVEGVRRVLPAEIRQAGAVIDDADAVLDRARAQAEQIVVEARERADLLVADQAVVAAATSRAQRVLDDAQVEADRLLTQADDYCDRRLADFEIDLDKLAQQVRRGREKLRGREGLRARADDALGPPADDGDPAPG